MNKILIIIRREYLRRVNKKSFILLTLLLPLLMVGLVAVPIWLGSINSDEQETVAIIDDTQLYIDAFQDTPQYRFVRANSLEEEFKSEDKELEAVVCITPGDRPNMPVVEVYARQEVQAILLSTVEQTINAIVQQRKLEASGVENLDRILADLSQPVEINTYKWTEDGAQLSSNTGIAMGSGMLLTFLIYMFVITYGSMVMQSVIEEKTGRIVEIMVSSVRPFQLMMGKIVGIMLVGLTQMAIWAVFIGLFLGFGGRIQGVSGSDIAQVFATIQGLPLAEMGVMFLLMFLGGFLLYASFFAAVGASVNEQEDSSQFVMPVMFVMIFAIYAAMAAMENTNGPLAFWASLFPLTSPVVMMVRLPFGVPLWQELLSLALLFATSVLMVGLGAKIYRIGILMYGKKPSLKEIVKWLKY